MSQGLPWKFIQCQRATLILLLFGVSAEAANWQPVTNSEHVRALLSDTVITGIIDGKENARAQYFADGTGILYAWGGKFPRTWALKENAQYCLTYDGETRCYRLEKDLDRDQFFRSIDLKSGEILEFHIEGAETSSVLVERGTSESGSASQPSAEELAAKLSNPTAPVMTIGNNFDFVAYDGDLPGASDQSAFRYVFQTTFPYKLTNGGTVFFRPAVPVIFNDKVPDSSGGYRSEGTDLGDTGFDLSYGTTMPNGFLWGTGLVGTLPTATNDSLGQDLWGLGPEVLLGVIKPWGVIGGVLSHQWDIAGSGDGEIDRTSLNYFYAFTLGGGWQIAASPTLSYDHTRLSGERWTVPLGIGVAKTTVLAGRAWKFQLQYWNFVESADAFGASHQIRLSINPVVSAPWNEDR